MARILVTGGSGFIGTNLLEYCRANGHDLLNVDHKPPKKEDHRGFWRNVDILDKQLLERTVRDFDPELIYHLAARTDLDGKQLADYAANTAGTRNVIHAASQLTSLKRIVFTSTRLVCRIGYMPKNESDYSPSTVYGASKIEMERIVRDGCGGLPCSWALFRPTSIWGPWFDVPYKTFFTTIVKGYYVHPGDRPILKSYGYVGNIVQQLDRAMLAPADAVHGKTFYLADYQPLDVRKWATLIQQTMGAKRIRTVPAPLLRPIAWCGDVAKRAGWSNPFLTTFRLNNLLTQMVHDVEPLKQVAGPTSYSLEEGVRTTVAWMRDRGEV
jgi:nucleoside-diphosphate-sugar epimerase